MAKKENNKNFEITLINAEGTCDTTLFKKMINKADVTSTPITKLVGNIFTPTGSANVHIKTTEKEFDRLLIDTREYGIIHTSSSVFEEGFSDYRGECDKMRVVGVKAKLGTCYKCVPVITAESEEVPEDSDEALPFE